MLLLDTKKDTNQIQYTTCISLTISIQCKIQLLIQQYIQFHKWKIQLYIQLKQYFIQYFIQLSIVRTIFQQKTYGKRMDTYKQMYYKEPNCIQSYMGGRSWRRFHCMKNCIFFHTISHTIFYQGMHQNSIIHGHKNNRIPGVKFKSVFFCVNSRFALRVF